MTQVTQDIENSPTDKEIFDRVKKHLLTQKQQSINVGDEPVCMYRDDRGLKCAVGALISNEVYDARCERAHIPYVSDVNIGKWAEQDYSDDPSRYGSTAYLARSLNMSGIPARESMRMLLLRLQRVHDQDDPATWENTLNDLDRYFHSDGTYDPIGLWDSMSRKEDDIS